MILFYIEIYENILRLKSGNIWYVIILPCLEVAQNLIYLLILIHGNVILVIYVILFLIKLLY